MAAKREQKYFSLRTATGAGEFFAQPWLASGVGLIMFSLYRLRTIPMVWCASLAINGSFALGRRGGLD